ncbi:hypothetical protein KIL84_015654 [Mauremys mutica]|uniref:Uncharacterized protein n=1 Tax=Mauremys mutica TaxID=74926 RepID=A0A9D4AM89_9SAUR|nr:hypothetical protein KIL84_015654 [Mauremys mutica]
MGITFHMDCKLINGPNSETLDLRLSAMCFPFQEAKPEFLKLRWTLNLKDAVQLFQASYEFRKEIHFITITPQFVYEKMHF